jgi:hypothetical protein
LPPRSRLAGGVPGPYAVIRETTDVALVLVVVVLALLPGLLLGGSPAGIAAVPLRSLRLVGSTVAIVIIGWLAAGLVTAAWPASLVVAAGFLALFVWRNPGVPGIPLAAAGIVLVAVVVVLNGAMPVSLRAAERAGVGTADQVVSQLADDPRHELADGATLLPWLGDVVPVALPGARSVASVGHVLLAAGLALFVVTSMRRAPRVQPVRMPTLPAALRPAAPTPTPAPVEDETVHLSRFEDDRDDYERYDDDDDYESVRVIRPETRDSDSTTTGS